jgi:hypothetical protein
MKNNPSESLKESLKEMKLMREGKKPKRNWREMFKDILATIDPMKPNRNMLENCYISRLHDKK